MRTWWLKFVASYQSGDADVRRNLLLKKQHTLRVLREALTIARQLNTAPADMRLLEVIVLLHDVGRFEQYARYRTFSDPKSTNHALLSLRIIRRSGVLDRLTTEQRTVIRRSILYHNWPRIPTGQSPRVRFFAQLLRDADKLDIWRLVIDYYTAEPGKKNHAISIGLADTPGSSREVIEDIRANRVVNSRNLRNLNDFKLLQMGWVFDVNFLPTLRTIVRRRYIEKLRNVLPDAPEVEEAYQTIQKYVSQRVISH
jgi:putative nucleotidyltransferase with HDIG domain